MKISPECLDAVQIDGRWAQVAVVRPAGVLKINWLDGSGYEEVWLEDFYTALYRGVIIADVRRELTEQEFSKLHWGADGEEKHKNLISVFGELRRKL